MSNLWSVKLIQNIYEACRNVKKKMKVFSLKSSQGIRSRKKITVKQI